MGDILKNWNNQKLIFRVLMHGLRNQIFTLRLRVLYLQYKMLLSIQEIIKKHICGLQSIIYIYRICEIIEHIISSCIVLAQSEYKKGHDIFTKIIHMNLTVKFNLLKDTQPHYIYKPERAIGGVRESAEQAIPTPVLRQSRIEDR
jgi:hypothetical protein